MFLYVFTFKDNSYIQHTFSHNNITSSWHSTILTAKKMLKMLQDVIAKVLVGMYWLHPSHWLSFRSVCRLFLNAFVWVAAKTFFKKSIIIVSDNLCNVQSMDAFKLNVQRKSITLFKNFNKCGNWWILSWKESYNQPSVDYWAV